MLGMRAGQDRPTRLRFKVLRIAAIAIVAAASAYAMLVIAAKPLLSIPTQIEQADIIVVLGGDAPLRASAAAALYRSGAAPRVLISGDGDCQDNRAVLLQQGVPDKDITVECQSRNTMQNSLFSAAIMQAAQLHRALIVTSWFHTRRALQCFRNAAPAMQFSAVSAGRDQSAWEHMWNPMGYQVIAEYLKIPWYALRYGIRP
jgi:uncharacterized SAM-binding protein YcdF (DUF218 family)